MLEYNKNTRIIFLICVFYSPFNEKFETGGGKVDSDVKGSQEDRRRV